MNALHSLTTIVRRQTGWAIGLTIIVLALAGALFATHAQPVAAENGSADALRVSPVRSDVSVKPGESTTVKLQVTNLTEHSIRLNPVENDFVAGDEKGTPSLILDENETAPTHSLKQFMKPLSAVSLEPRESKTVSVKISVPKDAQAGGYFGAVQFTPSIPGSGGQVNLNTHVASLILLTVQGNLVEKLDLTNFAVEQQGKSSPFYATGDSLVVQTRFENKGNIQLGPFGDVAVRKGGKVVSRASFNTDTPADMTLPDSARRWEIPLEGIGGFGKYEVLGTFSFGQNNQTIEASTTFWIIPRLVQVIALVVLALIILAAVLIPLLVRRKRRRVRRF